MPHIRLCTKDTRGQHVSDSLPMCWYIGNKVAIKSPASLFINEMASMQQPGPVHKRCKHVPPLDAWGRLCPMNALGLVSHDCLQLPV